MVQFARKEDGGPDRHAPKDSLESWKIPTDLLAYVEADRYVCCLDTSDPNTKWSPEWGDLTAAHLLEPGRFDDCPQLRPWATIDVIFGRSPDEARRLKLMVVATARKSLLGFEKARGLQLRKHTIVGSWTSARKISPSFGAEPVDAAPAAKTKAA